MKFGFWLSVIQSLLILIYCQIAFEFCHKAFDSSSIPKLIFLMGILKIVDSFS